MRKLFFSLALAGQMLLTQSPALAIETSSNITIKLSKYRIDIDRRKKNVLSSKLDKKHKESAMARLRNIESRYKAAQSLSRVKKQGSGAEDILTQLQQDLMKFDKTFNDYLAAASIKKGENKA